MLHMSRCTNAFTLASNHLSSTVIALDCIMMDGLLGSTYSVIYKNAILYFSYIKSIKI